MRGSYQQVSDRGRLSIWRRIWVPGQRQTPFPRFDSLLQEKEHRTNTRNLLPLDDPKAYFPRPCHGVEQMAVFKWPAKERDWEKNGLIWIKEGKMKHRNILFDMASDVSHSWSFILYLFWSDYILSFSHVILVFSFNLCVSLFLSCQLHFTYCGCQLNFVI